MLNLVKISDLGHVRYKFPLSSSVEVKISLLPNILNSGMKLLN